ncbi:hypothetical protein JCM19233_175 [Vibrio astriarenae]|nr:hypothetical protein JCM19233_175 [Vibrio sp. C7]
MLNRKYGHHPFQEETMKKMRRAQLHRIRIQYWKDCAKGVSNNKN